MGSPSVQIGQWLFYADNPLGITYGINGNFHAVDNQLYTDAVALGASRIRVNIEMGLLVTGNGVYNWTQLDPIVQACDQHGLRVTLIVRNFSPPPPSWASVGSPCIPGGTKTYTTIAALQAIAIAICKRYSGDGNAANAIASDGSGKRLQIDNIEIGNEDFDVWAGTDSDCRNPRRYVQYVRTIVPAMRASIASGGGNWVPRTSGESFPARIGMWGAFVQQQAHIRDVFSTLVSCPTDPTYNPGGDHTSVFGYPMLDYGNFHNYQDPAQNVSVGAYGVDQELQDIRAIVSSTTPIWMTEFGADGPCANPPASQQSQSTYFAANSDGTGIGALSTAMKNGAQHIDLFTMNYNAPGAPPPYTGQTKSIACKDSAASSGYIRFQAFTTVQNFLIGPGASWATLPVPFGFGTSGSGGGGGGGASGALSGSVQASPAGPINLTAEGTDNWAKYGFTSATSRDTKSGGGSQISVLSNVGSGTPTQNTGAILGYSWSDGTPDGAASNSLMESDVAGVNNGFSFTVPADTNSRTLHVYVAATNAQGKLTATLSDGSATAYTDSSINATSGGLVAKYTLTYNAASSGQTLTVQWKMQTDNGSGVTTYGADTFSRANASSWGPASDGTNTWAKLLGTDTQAIVSNEGQMTGATVLTVMALGTGTQADAEVLVRTAVSATGDSHGPIARATANNTHYFAQINGAGQFALGKYVGGTPTSLVHSTLAQVAGTYYWIRLRVQGSNLYAKVWQDGSSEPSGWTLTTTDTSITGAGQYGVRTVLASASDTASFDHFTATSIPGSGGSGGTVGIGAATIGTGSGGPPPVSGSLSGQVAANPSGPINLTGTGTSDWAKYGYTGATSRDDKISGGSQISTLATVGAGTAQQNSAAALGYSWSDGTPDLSATNTLTESEIIGASGSGTPHVMIVALENHSYNNANAKYVVGNPNMPNINKLLSTYSTCTAFYGVTHESLPNYLAFVSGSDQGGPADTTTSTFGGNTLADSLDTAGINWKHYAENLPSAGYTGGDSGGYIKHHNPWPYFNTFLGKSSAYQQAHLVNYSDASVGLSADLNNGAAPPFLFVQPNNTDNGHNSSTDTSSDTWVQNLVTMVQASSWYQAGGIIVLWYDESNPDTDVSGFGDAGSNPTYPHGGHTVCCVISAQNSGAQLSSQLNHYGVLKAIEELYGLPQLGNSAHTINGDLTPLLGTGSVSSVGNGFSFTVPADTGSRTLNIYVSLTNAQGKLTATLSDGSAATYTDSSINATGGTQTAVYNLTYNAATSGQSLAISWVMQADNGGGTIGLGGATLVAGSTPVPVPGILTGSTSTPSGVTPTGATFFVPRAFGGTLMLPVLAEGTVNLTTEGAGDWVHFGRGNALSLDRKSGVVQQISNFTPLGTGTYTQDTATDLAYSWIDGTPTPVESETTTGVGVSGVGNGFAFSAPADLNLRTLNIYVQATQARGQLTARLSDSSASAYSDASLDDTGSGSMLEYTLQYQAGSPNQSLTVSWTMLTDNGSSGTTTAYSSDSFTRANQSNWTTASDGESWVQSLITGSPTFSITSNEGKIAAAANGDVALALLGTQSHADAEALVRWQMSNVADSAGLLLRAASNQTYYRCNLFSGNTLQLSKVISGTATTLAQLTTLSFAANTKYWTRFRVAGSTLYANFWADGSSEPSGWTVTVSDSSITAAGGWGLRARLAGSPDSVQFDSYSVSSLPSGTSPGSIELHAIDTPNAMSSIPVPVTGGTPGTYSATINNQPVFIVAGSLSIDSSVGRRSQAAMTVKTKAATIFEQYQQVEIFAATGTLIFSGYITNPKTTRPGFAPSLLHQITCCDQHYLADKRVIAASYTNKTAGYIVQDIVKNWLAQEGVTLANVYDGIVPSPTLYPSQTLYPGGNVGTIPSAVFAYCTAAAALDALVKVVSQAGTPYYWQIDEKKQLWFVPYTAVVNSKVIDGSQIDLVQNPPSVTRANPSYRNTQYLTGGVTQTASQTETRVGDGNTVAWSMGYDLASAPTIMVGSVSQTVGIKGIDSGMQFYWQQGSPVITQDSSQTKLTSSQTLSVTYIGQYPTVIVDQSGAQITYQGNVDGTTGIVEQVTEDKTIISSAAGLTEASQYLTRYAVQGIQFVGSTLDSSYRAGQLATFDLPDFGLYNRQMLIETVNASDQQDGYNVWYTITAVAGPYDTTWVQFFGSILTPGVQANSVNVGVNSSLVIAQSFSATLGLSASLASLTGVPYPCPIPSLLLYPGPTLYPC